jgi:hypothetical protein
MPKLQAGRLTTLPQRLLIRRMVDIFRRALLGEAGLFLEGLFFTSRDDVPWPEPIGVSA